MGSISIPQSNPGILVVHPRLHDPTPENSATFLRWTKLHYRDLLSLPAASEDGGHVLRAMRFTSLDGNPKYGHKGDTESRYFYLVLASSISAFHTPQYYAMSRRLDLENTRQLADGDEAVGCEEAMVFDICDAKFLVYQDVKEGQNSNGLADYHGKGEKGKTCIIALSTPSSPQDLQVDFLGLWEARAPKELKVFSGVYLIAGDAQPNEHPKIEPGLVGGGEWLCLMLVVDEGGEILKVDHVEMMVEGFLKEKGVEAKFGVWKGEVEVE
jgi:hypothetical protein